MSYCVGLFLLFVSIAAFGYEYQPYRTLYGTTDIPVNVCWNAGDDLANHFEIQLRSFERTEVIQLSNVPSDSSRIETSILIPKTGHYFIDVRACNEIGCSDWISTEQQRALTSSTCNGEPVTDDGSPTWIYGYIAPPSGGVIN